MSFNLQRASLVLLVAGLLATPSTAAIVRARYEGEVNHVGTSAPDGFAIGQRVWGEFAYDTQTEATENWISPHQYAAVRQLSVNTASGFFANVNFGSVAFPVLGTPGNLNQPTILKPIGFQVTSLPPIVFHEEPYEPLEELVFITNSNGDIIGIVIDFGDLYTFSYSYGPDLDAAYANYLESVALGFPLPAGAFVDNPPFILSLTLSGEQITSNLELAQQPPRLELASQAIGSLYFGGWPYYHKQLAVEFNITSLTVVPEPSSIALMACGLIATMIRRRKPSSAKSTAS
jgi:hypothetical protein